MALQQNNLYGITVGTALTAANSGTGGNAFTRVTFSGSVTATVASASPGGTAQSVRIVSTATSSTQIIDYEGYSDTSAAASVSFMMNALPASGGITILRIRSNSGASNVASLLVSSTGKVQLLDAVNATAYTMTGTVVTGIWYRAELQVAVGTTTSNGTISGQWFPTPSSTTATDSFSSSVKNTGTIVIDRMYWGFGTTAVAQDFNLSQMQFNNGTTTAVGPYSAIAAPPTVSAGPNQSVLPFSAVTFAGSVSPASSHTATSAWGLSSGAPPLTSGATTPTPTISNVGCPTVASGGNPSDAVYTYTLTGTQDDSQTAQSSMTLTVAYSTRYRAHGGVWVGLANKKVAHAGAWV